MKRKHLFLLPLVLAFRGPSGGPQIKFDDPKYNFGFIREGEVVKHDFTFTNTGDVPLIITKVEVSCGCTVADKPEQPIRKGEKAVIHASFNSAGKLYRQERTITVTSNASNSPTVLTLKGVIMDKHGKNDKDSAGH